jgi:hypothetical protein
MWKRTCRASSSIKLGAADGWLANAFIICTTLASISIEQKTTKEVNAHIYHEKEGKKSNYHMNYLSKKERLIHDTEGYSRTTIYESTVNEMFFFEESANEMFFWGNSQWNVNNYEVFQQNCCFMRTRRLGLPQAVVIA